MNRSSPSDGTEDFDPENHAAEARERWGHTEAYAESQRRTARYGDAEWQAIRAESESIAREFAGALAGGLPPEAPEVLAIAERHRLHIERWFYPCPPEVHARLGRLYVEDPRFARHYDRRLPGLASYVCSAVGAGTGV